MAYITLEFAEAVHIKRVLLWDDYNPDSFVEVSRSDRELLP